MSKFFGASGKLAQKKQADEVTPEAQTAQPEYAAELRVSQAFGPRKSKNHSNFGVGDS
jgi:hypothetical protein